MFSCELCEISKNTFFTEHFRVTASESLQSYIGHLEKNEQFLMQQISTLLIFAILLLISTWLAALGILGYSLLV